MRTITLSEQEIEFLQNVLSDGGDIEMLEDHLDEDDKLYGLDLEEARDLHSSIVSKLS